MKNENKTTSVLILVLPSKNAFWNQSCFKITQSNVNQIISELQGRLLKRLLGTSGWAVLNKITTKKYTHVRIVSTK